MDNEMDMLDDNSLKIVIGKVERIRFAANDSFFKILVIKVDETNFDWDSPEITVTGSFAEISEDMSYKFSGQIVTHPTYGDQLKSVVYESMLPNTEDAVIEYLSSEKFVGIGKQTAKKIVRLLGEDAISIMKNDEQRIENLGLKNKQVEVLKNVLSQEGGIDNIIIGLSKYGFSSNMALKIYQHFKEDTLSTITENPYVLNAQVEGISFSKADEIARILEIPLDSPLRIQGGILQTLLEGCYEDGNTYLTAEQVLIRACELLSTSDIVINEEDVADQIIDLREHKKIIADKNHIYLPPLYIQEQGISQKLKAMSNVDNDNYHNLNYDDTKIECAIDEVQSETKIQFDDNQLNAIKTALKSPIFLLTGGPGTGKTTIINGIVSVYAKLNNFSLNVDDYKNGKIFPIKLVAPTGRAAKRMSESTGLPASTIHRLLGISGREETVSKADLDEISGNLLIIDETSMVDTELLDLLTEVIPQGMQLIMVGDKDQLPSVGPGQIFSDLLESKIFPTVYLQQIYRQTEGSSIVQLSHDILKGTLPYDFDKQTADKSFIPCDSVAVKSALEKIVKVAIKKGISSSDIQVLAPMYRGSAGIDILNTTMQDIVNPATNNKKQIKYGERYYRIGDRVLHLVNDPQNNVFNGDIGTIVGIDLKNKENKVEQMYVDFNGNEVAFKRKDFINLTLAYCMSIHKSQGGEFPVVILPMVNQFRRMFARNLLYTAITRAKSKLILLGEKEAFEQCCETQSSLRQTGLLEFLVGNSEQNVKKGTEEVIDKIPDNKQFIEQNVKNDDKNILTLTAIEKLEIDPMIGMNDVKPSDFM